MAYSLLTERRRHPPPGADGGGDGAVGHNLVGDSEVEPKASGTLRAGDRVDVIAALPAGTDSTIKPSKILLKNVRVLRPAQEVTTTPKLGSGGVDQTLSVLLSVADKDAQKLFYAMENGEWTLALRPIDGSAR
jgi:Flp pilus assembly protein CpaB